MLEKNTGPTKVQKKTAEKTARILGVRSGRAGVLWVCLGGRFGGIFGGRFGSKSTICFDEKWRPEIVKKAPTKK